MEKDLKSEIARVWLIFLIGLFIGALVDGAFRGNEGCKVGVYVVFGLGTFVSIPIAVGLIF